MLAWRLVRSRKTRFLSLITIIAVVGIACGVMALTIVLGVSSGFQESLQERILGMHPHLVVWPRDDRFTEYRQVMAALKQDPRVLGVTPATYDDMMLAHGDQRAGAVVKGMDSKTLGSVLQVNDLMTEGQISSLDETPIISRTAGTITLSNIVQETSWLALLWGDKQLLMHQNDLAVPFPGDARLAVVHADPSIGAIDVVVGNSPTGFLDLKAGNVSRSLVIPAGVVGLNIDEEPLGEDLTLESGKSYHLLLLPGGQHQLRQIDTSRPLDREARLTLIDARTQKEPVVVQVGETRLKVGASSVVSARLPAIVLGSVLARTLKVEVGDRVSLASPFRGLGERGPAPTGMEPSSGSFEVAGFFQSGYYDYDKRFSLVSLGAAQRFLNQGDRVRWLEVRVENMFDMETARQFIFDILQPYSLGDFTARLQMAQERMKRVLDGDVSQFQIEEPKSVVGLLRNASQLLSVLRTSAPHTIDRRLDYNVITWQEVNEPLFSALKLQKVVLSILFLIIIVVAAFNIVGTQIMTVSQKTREIAILKAMGASRWVIKRAFLIQGFMVSLFGTLIGVTLGLSCCVLLDQIGYPLEPEVYLISELPVAIHAVEVTLVVVAALALTLLATLYSAGKAGRLPPVKGIRYIE
jgi:lipoprotein-releasing system permease protein